MTNCKKYEGNVLLDPAPFSRAGARVHLSEQLIAELGVAAAGMARRERLLGKPLNIEQFAENVIRATLGAINASNEDSRYRDWQFEKLAIAQLDDQQAQQSFDRWKASATA